MPIYDVEIPGRGKFEVESAQELTPVQAYQYALSQSEQKMASDVSAPKTGGLRGARDTLDSLAQMLPRTLAMATSLGGTVENDVSRFFTEEAKKVDALNKAVEQKYQQERKARGEEGTDFMRVLGNIASTIVPAAAAPSLVAKTSQALTKVPQLVSTGQAIGRVAATPVGQAAIGGAAAGALEPVLDTEQFATEKAKQIGLGAVTGAGTQKALSGLGRVLSPQTSAEARKLAEQGVQLTPGQILGGTAKRLEEAAKSIPFAGDIVTAAEKRSIETFNKAVINETLEPLGKKVPKSLFGREAITFADDAISNAYNKVLSKVKVSADNTLLDDLAAITSDATNILPTDRANQLAKIVDDKILNRMKSGEITGTAWKSIDSDLGRLAKNFLTSSDGDQRLLGSAIKESQLSIRNLLARVNPQYADQINKANQSFAKFLRVERAASGVGAQEGVFSPAQLLSATKALDESIRKGAFARGEAGMQQTAEAAKKVMGANLPDSGTAYRGMTGLGVLGAGYIEPTALLAPIAVGGAYTQPVQSALRALLMQRPDLARTLGNQLQQVSPVLAPAGTAGLLGQ